jgi:NifU-like protein involved in Fe-S cluster formation
MRGAGDPETPDASPALGELAAFAALAAFPGRRPCATLPWLALRAALGARGSAALDP